MSDKTLVEMLRSEDRCSTCLPVCLENILGIEFECHEMECSECHSKAYNALADAIERKYLPLPMLEGKPLIVGDKVDGYNQEGAEVVAVMNSEMVVVRSTVRGGNGYHDEAYPLLLWDVSDLVRHNTEVLDSDGIPIRVGDHVWFKQGTHYDNVEYVVTEITKTQVHYKNSESEYPRGECPHYCASSNLTHKQPDSLERIEEDAEKSVCEYFSRKIGDCENCEGFGGCRVKMMRDLLRRQRAILENK